MVKTGARFGLRGPDYPQVSILKVVGAVLNFEVMALMTSKAKTEAGFGLGGILGCMQSTWLKKKKK